MFSNYLPDPDITAIPRLINPWRPAAPPHTPPQAQPKTHADATEAPRPNESATKSTPDESPKAQPLTASIAPSDLSTPALETELLSLAGHLAAGQCRWLLLLAEFDARDGWAGPGMRSCAQWLSWRVGMSPRTALEQLRVARALTTLPLITAVFAEGRLSYSKVRAITRIATPETEQTLLDLALAGTAHHVERIVRLTRQGRADPRISAGDRALRWRFDDEGRLHLTATLPAEQGAQLVTALDGLVQEHSQAGSARSAEHPEDSGNAAEPPTTTTDTLAARRADALVALATGSRPPTTELVVHLDVDQHGAEIESGPGLPMPSADRLACDAKVRAVLADRSGNPLYLGRTRRLVSKVMLAALIHRDDHQCRFPGCTHTRWLRAHHIRHWLRGGPTDIDNLVLLCEFHHRLVHEYGYRVNGHGTALTFTTPDGVVIPPSGPPTEGSAASLVELSDRRGRASGTDPLTPTWAGEPLDPTPILMRLLPPAAPVAA